VLRYAEALAFFGDQVDVIALEETDNPKQENLRGVQFCLTNGRGNNEENELTYSVRIFKYVFNPMFFLVRKNRQDPYGLNHVHNMQDVGIFAVPSLQFSGTKVIVDVP